MKRYILALAVCATPATAGDDPVVELLNLYAEHSGTVAACNRSDLSQDVEGMAADIAEWKYPGFFASFGSDRRTYRDLIAANAKFIYTTSRLEGCPSVFEASVTQTLADAAHDALVRAVSN